jgi:hypothetical protein
MTNATEHALAKADALIAALEAELSKRSNMSSLSPKKHWELINAYEECAEARRVMSA